MGKSKETSGIFVDDTLIPAALGTETNGFIRKAPNQNASRLVPIRENLTYLKDNWVHFITEDLSLDSDNNLVLLDLEAISQSELSKFNPRVGDVRVTPYRNRNIYSLVISASHRETTPNNLATSLKTLESRLRNLDIHSIRIGKCGEITDNIPKGVLNEGLRKLLGELDLTITVCSSACRPIPEEERKRVIQDHHDGLYGENVQAHKKTVLLEGNEAGNT